MGGGRGGWGRGGASGRSPVCCCWSHSAGGHAGGLNCSSGRTDRKRGRESRGEAVSRLWGPALSSGRDSVSAASSLFLTWAGPFRASASYLYNESGGGGIPLLPGASGPHSSQGTPVPTPATAKPYL